MSTNVVPFPLSRRVAFVERHADIISSMTPKSATRHLAYQLQVQRNALERRGVSAARIDREIASLERAILALSQQESVA
jgi:acyl transferase domain-containing protein